MVQAKTLVTLLVIMEVIQPSVASLLTEEVAVVAKLLRGQVVARLLDDLASQHSDTLNDGFARLGRTQPPNARTAMRRLHPIKYD